MSVNTQIFYTENEEFRLISKNKVKVKVNVYNI